MSGSNASKDLLDAIGIFAIIEVVFTLLVGAVFTLVLLFGEPVEPA